MLDNVNFYYEDGAVDIITRDPETDHVRWQTWVYFSDFMRELGKLGLPMDTAPRDGTRVLVLSRLSGWCVVGWKSHWSQWGTDALCWLPLPGKPEGV